MHCIIDDEKLKFIAATVLKGKYPLTYTAGI